MRLRLLMVLCAGLFACDKSNSNNNNNTDGGNDGGGGGNFSVISRQETLAVGSTQCPNGGVLVHVGLDDGSGGGIARDGVLQDGEIDNSTPICGVGVTYNTVVKATALPLGDLVCNFGGSKLEYGLDNGENGGTANNGVLEDGERDGFINACLPAPSDLLVETIDLYPGDTTCLHGGVIVHSGLDDGRDGGTKGNGVLETGEITLNQTRCNPSPTDKFPAPTGGPGAGAIDGRGGPGAGTGSGSSTASGNGGSFFGVNLPGPLAGSVEIHANGTVTPNAATSTATYTAGGSGSELVVSTDAPAVATLGALQSDPDLVYLFKPEPNTDLGTQQPQGIYKGMTLITSIHVTTTGKLKLKDSFGLGAARAWVSGDIRNEGTIVGLGSADEPATLILESHHLINEAGATIGQPGAAVALIASQGTGGELVNRGDIVARGPDAVGTTGDVSGRTITLVAEAGITNTSTGKIIARGGNDDASGFVPRNGGVVGALAFRGSFKNGGTIDVSGGKGAFGGAAGKAVLIAGPLMMNMPGVGTYLPQYPDLDPDIINGGAGTFDFDQSGTIKADGGDALGTAYNGGLGGDIFVLAHGGSIRGSNAITAVGGASTSNGPGTFAGNGGRITVQAATLVTPNGDLQIPAEVSLTGTYNYRGGAASGTTGAQRGGNGGTMVVVVDADVGGIGGAGEIIDWDAQQAYDHNKIIASTAKPRLQLLGIANVHLQGASATGSVPGSGGAYYGIVVTCGTQCYYPRVDSHYVVTNTAVNLSGGSGAFNSNGGNAGGAFLAEIGTGNQLPAVIEASQLDVRGTLNLKGGDMTSSGGGSGGFVNMQATSGDALIEASPVLGGGASDNGAGGSGGSFNVFAFQTTINGDINNSGGVGTSGSAQAGGMNVDGYRVSMTGDLSSIGRGSATRIKAADSITITGAVNFSSVGFDSPGAGYIVLEATNISTSGPIVGNGAATAGTATQGGSGGGVGGRGNWTNNGTVTMNGGNATSATAATGGSGGGIEFSGKITGGLFTFNGGAATATGDTTDAAVGGQGGYIALYTGKEPAFEFAATANLNGGAATTTGANTTSVGGQGGQLYLGANKGTVNANGGAASGGSTATGGRGGNLTLNTNSANLSLVGGNASGGATNTGGAGGDASEVLANTACINVNGGTPGGAAGTPPAENVCL